jgi:glycosyltransferase involved in cell wall biosynthesis
MKIAYFVSMKYGLETFINNEIDSLKGFGNFIDLYPTKIKKKIIQEKINYIKKNIILIIFYFFKNLIISPKVSVNILYLVIKFNLYLEYILFLSWQGALTVGKYDVFHGSFADRKFFIAFIANKFFKKKLTVSIHAHEIYAQPNKKFFKYAINFCDSIHTISNKNKQILVKNYRVDPKKIKLIKLPIDSNFWKYKPKIYVITVARYTERKGWYDLVKAAKMLNDNYHFITVGFGELDLFEIVKKYDVTQKFTILPKMNSFQIRELLNISDIFCLPSKFNKKEGSEGIPVSIMEAMSVGLPIITTNDGSITELVKCNIVHPGNPRLLSKEIHKIGLNLIKNKSKNISTNNRKIVIKNHNIKNYIHMHKFFHNA